MGGDLVLELHEQDECSQGGCHLYWNEEFKTWILVHAPGEREKAAEVQDSLIEMDEVSVQRMLSSDNKMDNKFAKDLLKYRSTLND